IFSTFNPVECHHSQRYQLRADWIHMIRKKQMLLPSASYFTPGITRSVDTEETWQKEIFE
ncbi:unnamed protein product, partial [Nesidiocoris tenuis]